MTRTGSATYSRIPGRRILSLGIVHKVYAGPDHLLLLSSTSFSETYKRFYYRDIQAVVTRKTWRGAAWNAALAAAAAPFLYFAATGGSAPSGWTIFSWICALFFLLLLLVNWLRGPTCAAHLRTAVHLVELPTLGRLRSARKAVALLRPRIAEAQGALAPDAPSLAAANESRDAAAPPVPPPVPAAAPPAGGTTRAHEFLFYALLADGIVSIVSYQVRNPWLTLLGAPAFMTATAFLIAAMIRQRQRPVHPALRKAVWVTAAYWAASIVLGYAVALAVVFRNPAVSQNQWEFIKYIASVRPADSPFLKSVHLFGIVCPLTIGMAGLVTLLLCGNRERRRGTRPTPAGS